jgi:MFS family permease
MADSKAVENDREVVSQEEGEKEAMGVGQRDLTIGGKRERKLVLKMDLHLVPLIMLLYAFSFLDRYVTPSKAKRTPTKSYQSQHWKCAAIQHGERPRSGRKSVPSGCVSCLCDLCPVRNAIKYGFDEAYSATMDFLITTLWGIIATLTGLRNTYGQLVACRLLLGVVEAGLFPDLTVYLTFSTPRRSWACELDFSSSALQ